ncbi:MAG: hypothetical protein B7C24_05345 [Bacteroidetes bacterium 4572_77]|nr:MAG: hypothetical protein B7C24_05345 [Bacteroidetes bacterium 4572_77]
MNRAYLEKYIQFFTTEAVAERGRKLYEKGALITQDVDLERNLADFYVQGSQLYQVRISGFNNANPNLQTSCTCPYQWDTLCKHTVACLLYLADLDKETYIESKALEHRVQENYNPPVKRKSGAEPYELVGYKMLNVNMLSQYLRRDGSLDANIKGKIKEFRMESKDSISFAVERYGYEFYYRNADSWVSFRKKDDKVFVYSDDNNPISKLSKNEACAISTLLRIAWPQILDSYFNGGLDKQIKDNFEKYRLPENTIFSDYFSIEISKNNFVFRRQNKGEGFLLPEDNLEVIENFQQVTNKYNELPTYQKREERGLGFLIVNNPKGKGYSVDHSFMIAAIKGKLNKKGDKMISKIDEDYDDMADSFVAEIKEDEQTQLMVLQQIFELLSAEKFIFTVKPNRFYDFRKSDLKIVQVWKNPVPLTFKVIEKDSILSLKSYFAFPDKQVLTTQTKNAFLTAQYKDTIIVYDSLNASYYLRNYPKGIKMSEAYKKEFSQQVVKKLSTHFKFEFQASVSKKKEHFPNVEFKQLYISENEEMLKMEAVVVYDNGQSFLLSQKGNTLEWQGEDDAVEYKRDRQFENDYLSFLSDLHKDFSLQKHQGFFYLPFEELMRDMWFFKFYEKLQEANIEVFGINNLKNFKYSPYKASVKTGISSGQDWFELDLQVKFGDYEIQIDDLKKAVINKQEFIKLKNGSIGILPKEWLDKMDKYFRNGQIDKHKLKISKLRFNVVEELFENIDDEKVLKEITQKKAALKNIVQIEKVKKPRGIKAQLRPYQMEGLQWLSFLESMSWGGILADDMGLGKTLQMLSFFKMKQKKKSPPSLVILPTTLLFNWENEIEKFTTGLSAYYHYGSARKKEVSLFDNYDLIISSYGVLVKDIEYLKDYKFHFIVLDESQAIKNPASQRYKAALLLQGKTKFALTGTPIENSTFDLYAQMNFVNPGFFGDIKSFKDNYSNKIDKEGNQEISQELQKITHPFILRRTKEQVVTELPPKTEDVIYCEMAKDQRAIYEAYRNKYRDEIMSAIETDGVGKSKLMVLEGLLRLRQICDSPLLLKEDAYVHSSSAKISELIRFITQKTADHKILVFSQFVSMLHLIRDELNNRQIDFEYLDGKSSQKQRQQSVENFQNKESLRVFLVSLKAGGTGLNLTAADYVFIVDPWWNPAVESQAIDRCYRIGQDKKVFAYRMITKDTVEEKILDLQNKKKKIARDIIQTDESLLKSFKTEDIRSLFS